MKNSLLRNPSPGRLILVLAAALLTGCGPDYAPIGAGLTSIGICFVVYGVVNALADLIKGEQSQAAPPPASRPRKRTDAKGKENQP